MVAQTNAWRNAVWGPVSAVAGYDPPQELVARFNLLFESIRSSTVLVARMESVREGLVASHYHLARLGALEKGILDSITRGVGELPPLQPNEGVMGGNTRALDFEYQAMLLALRRVLEYLGRSIEAHLAAPRARFAPSYADRLVRKIKSREPARVSNAVSSMITSFVASNSDLIGDGSARNQLVHHESLRLGTLNIGKAKTGGLRVTLGGEQISEERLGRWDSIPLGSVELINPISELMKNRLERTEQHVFDVYGLLTSKSEGTL